MENVFLCRSYVRNNKPYILSPKQTRLLIDSVVQTSCKLICLNIQLCLCGRNSIPCISGIHRLWGLPRLEKEMSL